MDVSKVKAGIDAAHKELNTVIDATWKARQLKGLRELDRAVKALETAEKHLSKAVDKSTPEKAAETPKK